MACTLLTDGRATYWRGDERAPASAGQGRPRSRAGRERKGKNSGQFRKESAGRLRAWTEKQGLWTGPAEGREEPGAPLRGPASAHVRQERAVARFARIFAAGVRRVHRCLRRSRGLRHRAPGVVHPGRREEYTIHWTASKKCPGACVLFGCVHRGTDLCLVMKLYTGGSLHELLDARRDPVDETKRQPLSVDETVAFALPLVKALSQLHRQNVVCNDLKPGNVLRDADGSLVISDFGLATILERTMLRASTTRAAEGGGTAPYMAPEQHDSESFGRVSARRTYGRLDVSSSRCSPARCLGRACGRWRS